MISREQEGKKPGLIGSGFTGLEEELITPFDPIRHISHAVVKYLSQRISVFCVSCVHNQEVCLCSRKSGVD